MKFIRSTGGYIKWDHKRNYDILDKPKTKPVTDYIQNCQRKWKEHMNRMNTGRIQKQILSYQTRGQRSFERPMKRFEEYV